MTQSHQVRDRLLLYIQALVCAGILASCQAPGGVGDTPQDVPSPQDTHPSLAKDEVHFLPSIEILDFHGRDHLPSRHLEERGTHEYLLELKQDEFIQLQLLEEEGDLFIQIRSPTGQDYPQVDSSQDTGYSEPVLIVADAPGVYRLQVGSFNLTSQYSWRRIHQRPAMHADRARTRAYQTFFEARTLRRKPEQAIPLYREAIRSWESLPALPQTGRAYFELGNALRRNQQSKEALSAYRRAREAFSQIGDFLQETWTLHLLGGTHSQLQQLRQAQDLYSKALKRWCEVNNGHEVAKVAHDLGRLHYRLGRPEKARQLYEEGLQSIDPRHRRSHEDRARLWKALGALDHYHGDISEAIRNYERALGFIGGDPRPSQPDKRLLKAQILTRLGSALPARRQVTVDDHDAAHQTLQAARQIHQELRKEPKQDPRLETRNLAGLAATNNSLGLLFETIQWPKQALREFDQALRIFTDLEFHADAAVVRSNRCRVLGQVVDTDRARTCYLEALDALEALAFHNAQAHTLVGLAENARARGELVEALTWSLKAIRVNEDIRGEATDPELRSTFLDQRYGGYQLAIDLAIELHVGDPENGYDAEAFRLFESSRARGLLDALNPPGLIEGSPFLTAKEVRELLDADTALLAFHLGELRSAVWLITRTHFQLQLLPRRSDLEEDASSWYKALSNGTFQRRRFEALGKKLATDLLGPIPEALDASRWIVIPSGALRAIPFSALHDPASLGSTDTFQPLVETHQITYAPSASTVAAQRRQPKRDISPSYQLTVISQPAWHLDQLPESVRQKIRQPLESPPLSPLPYAGIEAKSILNLFPEGSKRLIQGLNANRDAMLQGLLDNTAMLHFINHGELDAQRGEQSSLYLSRFDRFGHEIEYKLSAHDIAGMDLSADLVVLSACDSALGESLRGEGLVGLTHAFFHAGSKQVVASLWKVKDRTTSRLMAHFYRALQQQQMQPPEALTYAQRELRREGYTSPYYWSPFVLQGDWASDPPQIYP